MEVVDDGMQKKLILGPPRGERKKQLRNRKKNRTSSHEASIRTTTLSMKRKKKILKCPLNLKSAPVAEDGRAKERKRKSRMDAGLLSICKNTERPTADLKVGNG